MASLGLPSTARRTQAAENASSLRPRYARVDGDIETVWQLPRGEPKGIFFFAHGCNHQATDLFSYTGRDGWIFQACTKSNFGKCLGLPEEVRLRQIARTRGYVVVAVSGGSGRQSCWDLDKDGARVRAALRHVRSEERLLESLPVLAVGGSSGGAFVSTLAMPIAQGGLPGLRCVVPMIMGSMGLENRGVPTLYVHMPRDGSTAEAVASDVQQLTEQGVQVSELRIEPSPVSLGLLEKCLHRDVARDALYALRNASLLDARGYLREDSRKRLWVDPVRGAIRSRSADTLAEGESCLAEEMNVAWAAHELTTRYAERTIDFCEASAPQQVLVFDAGSSGTRVHVFNLYAPLPGAHVPSLDFSVREKQTLKVKPGLSHFARAGDLLGTARSIHQLLDFTNRFVPPRLRATTPVLLKATAGLRAVPEARAEAVLLQVRETLAASGYSFRGSWADIITGREEAGLAWLAANFLKGTFDRNYEGTSLGIIEMGGGSTQVSFQVDLSEALVESDKFIFTTALGRSYHVYAHSYLGYGQDYAQNKLRLQMPDFEAADPCYPKGYRRKAQGSLYISGSGDARRCSAGIQASLFNGSSDAPGHYAGERPLRGKFVATQNFFYARKDLGLSLASNASAMREASSIACLRTVESQSGEQTAANSCFGLCYQVVMMNALRAWSTAGVEVQIANQINGGDADWALGAALVHFLQESLPAPPAGSRLAGTYAVPQSRHGFLPPKGSLQQSTAWFTVLAAFALVGMARMLLWPRLRRLGAPRKAVTSLGAQRIGNSPAVLGGGAE